MGLEPASYRTDARLMEMSFGRWEGFTYADLQTREAEALAAREREVTQLLAAGKPTAPSPMGEEKAANPFLRADVPEVAKAVGMAGAPAAEVFAEIRTRKNKF